MFSKFSHIALLAALLCFFFQQVSAATLNDFTPRLSDLTGDCQKLYTSEIKSCDGSDFSNRKCSTACISSLQSLGDSVRKSCKGQGKDGTIIAAFLSGHGASQLCPNADDADLTDSTTTISATHGSATIGSSTMVLSSTSVYATGLIIDTSSTPSPVHSTARSKSPSVVTAISTATIQPVGEQSVSVTSTITGSSLAFDTNTPSSIVEIPTETTPASITETHTAKETHKNGGSPFDSPSAAATTRAAPMLLLCAALLWFV